MSSESHYLIDSEKHNKEEFNKQKKKQKSHNDEENEEDDSGLKEMLHNKISVKIPTI